MFNDQCLHPTVTRFCGAMLAASQKGKASQAAAALFAVELMGICVRRIPSAGIAL
jgi:hypothetical protein